MLGICALLFFYIICNAQTSNISNTNFGIPLIVDNSIDDRFIGHKKCCPIGQFVLQKDDGSYFCQEANYNTRQFFLTNITFEPNVGFPDCNFRVLKNEKYKWFRDTSQNTIEVGLLYALKPLWLAILGDYCIDSYGNIYNANQTVIPSRHNNGQESGYPKSNNSMKNKLIAFCNLEGLTDLYWQSGIAVLILSLSALVNAGTITIYIIVRDINKSREWIQFSIFVCEFFYYLSLMVHIVLSSYYLQWNDPVNIYNIPVYMILVYTVMYSSGIKWALGAVASIDLFLCVWSPFSSLDESRRSKRNYAAMFLGATAAATPAIFAHLHQYISKKRFLSDSIYIDSNIRFYDLVPKYLNPIARFYFLVVFLLNIFFACTSAIIIHRQKNQFDSNTERFVRSDNRKSFIIYVKLISSSEIPLLVITALIWGLNATSLHIIWNLIRFLYLVSAIYVFVSFGCSKKNRIYMFKIYRHRNNIKKQIL